MSELPSRCEPCVPGASALTEGEAQAYASDVPRWTLEFPRIQRSFRLPNFRKALAFVNRVGMLAEEEGHHPDIHITDYKSVEFVLSTHAVGGLSLNDFVMARKIDALADKDGLN